MASISQVSDVFAVFAATHTTYGITSAEILPTTLHWWHAIDPTKFCLLRGGLQNTVNIMLITNTKQWCNVGSRQIMMLVSPKFLIA
jgi:hypothetical protein